MNVHKLINRPVTLLFNPDNDDFAKGSLFLDQGEKQSDLDNQVWEYYNFQFVDNSIQFIPQGGKLGTQDGFSLESVKILNGERFKYNDIACYLSRSKNLKPYPLTIRWAEEESALHIFSENSSSPLRFSDIQSIYFSIKNEYNICEMSHDQ